MAINLANLTPAAYQGRLTARPVGICKPSTKPPQSVCVVIDWSLYPNHCVTVNLMAGAGQQTSDALDYIKSCYIDNDNVRSSVTILFPDTGYEVICEPNATLAAPVLTGQKTFVIVGGFTANAGTTKIYLNNFPLEPFESKDIAEVLSAGYATTLPGQGAALIAFGVGDSTHEVISLCSVLTNVQVLPAVPLSPHGFYILTSLDFSVVGNYSDAINPISMQYRLQKGANIYYQWAWYARNDINDFSQKKIAHYPDIQTRIDADAAIELVNITGVAVAGAVILTLNYTQVDDIV